MCSEVDRIAKDDTLEIDLAKGLIKNITKKKEYQSEKFPSFMQEIIKKGGLLNWIKKQR